ncbi:MAG: hypothetical protein EOP50_11365, partial [Sphingobacteriales bacterium]
MPFSGITYFPAIPPVVKPVLVMRQAPASIGGALPITLNGLLEVERSFSLTGPGTKTIRDGITGSGTLTIEAGSGAVILNGPAPILGGSDLRIVTDDYFYIPNGLTIPADSTVSLIGFPGSVFTGKGTNSFTVNGTIDMGTVNIDNPAGAVTINGVFKTAHAGGLEGGCITAASVVNVNGNSTIEYNSTGNQAITSSTVLEGPGTYYNLTFSGGGVKTLAGTANVSNHLRIGGVAVVDALLYNIGSASAAFTMTGGRLQLGTGGVQPQMAGVYTISAGVVQFARNSGPQLIRSGAGYVYHDIEVAGNQTQINGGADVYLNAGGIFYIKSTGTLNSGNQAIQGPTGVQAFVMETGGTLFCTNEAGFSGPLSGINSPAVRSNVENISLAPGSTIHYSRSGAQTITNDVAYQHLVLTGSGNRTAPAGTLAVAGNFTKSGTSVFAHNNGKVTFTGTAGQTFSNVSGFPIELYDLTNSSSNTGLTVNSDSLAIANELVLSPGSKLNLAGGNIILRSTMNGTASLATVPNESNIIN